MTGFNFEILNWEDVSSYADCTRGVWKKNPLAIYTRKSTGEEKEEGVRVNEVVVSSGSIYLTTFLLPAHASTREGTVLSSQVEKKIVSNKHSRIYYCIHIRHTLFTLPCHGPFADFQLAFTPGVIFNPRTTSRKDASLKQKALLAGDSSGEMYVQLRCCAIVFRSSLPLSATLIAPRRYYRYTNSYTHVKWLLTNILTILFFKVLWVPFFESLFNNRFLWVIIVSSGARPNPAQAWIVTKVLSSRKQSMRGNELSWVKRNISWGFESTSSEDISIYFLLSWRGGER